MGYPIYHSQYTAAQIEAAIGKGPRVNTAGYWEVWNVGTGAYESTGVGAGVTPPTVVTQVSQMTNHGYIYIYNGTETGYTAGYWYYWDGSAWTAGGAYQVAATDTTLTIAGAAADAKATGDAVDELKSALIGRVNAASASDWQNVAVVSTGDDKIRISSSTTRLATTKKLALETNEFISVKVQAGYKHRVLFFANYGSGNVVIDASYVTAMGDYDDQTTWHTETERVLQCPQGAVAYTVSFAKVDDATISTSDSANISLVASWGTEVWKTYDFDEIVKKIPALDGVKLPNYIKKKFDYKLGYITATGAVTDYGQNAIYYDDIKVTAGESYTLLFDVPYYGVCFAWYEQDGTFISRDNSFSYTVSISEKTSEAPSGAYYAKVAVYVQSGALDNVYVNAHTFILTDTEFKMFSLTSFEDNSSDSRYSGKVLSILGDSISTFAGYSGQQAQDGHKIADGVYTYTGNHCRYPTNYCKFATQTYWMKLIARLGMTLGENDSWAGSRVSWGGAETSDQGEDIYIASPTRINHLDDNGTPDYILVNAGTNDIGNSVTVGTFDTENPVNYTDAQIAALPVATFADAYRALLIRLQKKYPLAKIIVMLPDYTTSYYNPAKADEYLEIIKEACDYFGIPWVDMRTVGITMYNTGTYLGDGIHPNVAGMELMAQKMVNFFEYSIT